jgi:hypothetical protein
MATSLVGASEAHPFWRARRLLEVLNDRHPDVHK